jgi:hypothetical protein
LNYGQDAFLALVDFLSGIYHIVGLKFIDDVDVIRLLLTSSSGNNTIQ